VRQNFDVPLLKNARATLSVEALGHASILILIYEVRMLPLLRLVANRRLWCEIWRVAHLFVGFEIDRAARFHYPAGIPKAPKRARTV
jgi:hypothetical protein